jgi:hypothetical protein
LFTAASESPLECPLEDRELIGELRRTEICGSTRQEANVAGL